MGGAASKKHAVTFGESALEASQWIGFLTVSLDLFQTQRRKAPQRSPAPRQGKTPKTPALPLTAWNPSLIRKTDLRHRRFMTDRSKRRRKGDNQIPRWGWIPIGVLLIILLIFWFAIRSPISSGQNQTRPQLPSQDRTIQADVGIAQNPDTARSLALELMACGTSAISHFQSAQERLRKSSKTRQEVYTLPDESDKRSIIAFTLLQNQVTGLRSRVRKVISETTDTEAKRLLAELQIVTEDLLDTVTVDRDMDGTRYLYPLKSESVATIRANQFLELCRRIDLLSGDGSRVVSNRPHEHSGTHQDGFFLIFCFPCARQPAPRKASVFARGRKVRMHVCRCGLTLQGLLTAVSSERSENHFRPTSWQ